MQWLIDLTQFGQNKCKAGSLPSVFCSGLLLFVLLICLLSIAGSAVDDTKCVIENKKTLFRWMSVLVSVISFGGYYFVWHRYIGNCNCLVGFAVTTLFVNLASYIPNAIAMSLQDQSCVLKVINEDLAESSTKRKR